MSWKFVDANNLVVFRVLDGRAESCLASVLPDGTEIAAADQPSHADLVAQALEAARRERQPIIGILDGLQASALTNGDTATAASIETSKQGLRDITKVDLSACLTYADMRAAILGAYAAIVANASTAVRTAFREVVA